MGSTWSTQDSSFSLFPGVHPHRKACLPNMKSTTTIHSMLQSMFRQISCSKRRFSSRLACVPSTRGAFRFKNFHVIPIILLLLEWSKDSIVDSLDFLLYFRQYWGRTWFKRCNLSGTVQFRKTTAEVKRDSYIQPSHWVEEMFSAKPCGCRSAVITWHCFSPVLSIVLQSVLLGVVFFCGFLAKLCSSTADF